MSKDTPTKLKVLLPKPIKSVLRKWYRRTLVNRYECFLRKLEIKQNQLLILSTIARSGTHYTKFLFANYIKLASGIDNGPVTPKEMNSMLPNIWHYAYLGGHPFSPAGTRKFKKPTPDLALLGLVDIPRSHYPYMHSYWGKSPILHIYRNPLDYAVSIYHYKFKDQKRDLSTSNNGLTTAGDMPTIANPVEALEYRFDDYVNMYLSYRSEAQRSRPQLLRMSYEDLKRSPEACLRMIIRWLGIEPHSSTTEKAVHYSSIKTVNQLERPGGTIQPERTYVKGKFARDGSIGQWKEYFTESDLEHFANKFASAGINLDEFTLED